MGFLRAQEVGKAFQARNSVCKGVEKSTSWAALFVGLRLGLESVQNESAGPPFQITFTAAVTKPQNKCGPQNKCRAPWDCPAHLSSEIHVLGHHCLQGSSLSPHTGSTGSSTCPPATTPHMFFLAAKVTFPEENRAWLSVFFQI